MRTEKEGAEKPAVVVLRVVPLQCIRADEVIDARKERIDQKVADKHQAQEFGPADIDEMEIWMDIPPAGSAAPDVESSVLVDGAPQNTADLLVKPGSKVGLLT